MLGGLERASLESGKRVVLNALHEVPGQLLSPMIATTTKSRLFEEYMIPTEGNNSLFAMAMMPKRPPARRLHAAADRRRRRTAPLTFRNMIRHGCILLSFQYRGHPRCTGVFDLDATVADTRYAMLWSWDFAAERGLPLHALTQCYGTVPLLAQFAAAAATCLLSRSASVPHWFA